MLKEEKKSKNRKEKENIKIRTNDVKIEPELTAPDLDLETLEIENEKSSVSVAKEQQKLREDQEVMEVSMIDDYNDMEIETKKPEPIKYLKKATIETKPIPLGPKSLTSKPTDNDEFQIFKELEGIDFETETSKDVESVITWSTVSFKNLFISTIF